MLVLSMHPEWQDRAREEVLRVFGNNKIYYEGVNRLKTVSTNRNYFKLCNAIKLESQFLINILCR